MKKISASVTSKKIEKRPKESVCRTCMVKLVPLRPLFPLASQTRSFECALFLTTGLQIKLNDGLSQKICKKCSETIERAIKLRKISHNTEKKVLISGNYKKISDIEKRGTRSAEKGDVVCRTCMGSAELRPLFPLASQYRSFERVLFVVTGLQIEVNDGLPQRICRKCAKIVEATINFRFQSHATEKRILKYNEKKKKGELIRRSEKVHKNVKIEPHEDISIKEEITVKLEDEIKSDLTDISLDLGIEEIKQEEWPDSPDRFSSEEDYFGDFASFVDNEALLETKEYHRPYLDLIEGEGPIDPKKPVQCKICKKISKCLNAFASHSAIHLGYEILCEYCGQKCLNIGALLRHQRGKHGLARDQSFACSYCEFLALDKEMLESHERRLHTKERPFVCDECGEAFYTKRVLTQHSYTHKADKPFQCNLCPSKFKLRNHLTTHTNLVHKKKFKYTYGCYMCTKRYKKPFETRKHLVRVHGVPKEQQGKVLRFNIEEHAKALPLD